jgi:nitrite reductase/ring-hydroxylating ferredoxin subunit
MTIDDQVGRRSLRAAGPLTDSSERQDLVLRDGTALRSLVDDETHTVSFRVYCDRDIFELEMERLFAKAWIAIAHETEVPEPDDFVTRVIGEDPVIVARDREGQLHVMLNVCAHRGMLVCRTDMGKSRYFRCPYHGWTYDAGGHLRAVPMQKEMYEGRLDRHLFGLMKARVATCGGMIWATWDPDAPSLDEYLGDFKWYLEVMWHRSDLGTEVVGPPQRWTIDANWKFAAEQFACDAYHFLTLHESMSKLGMKAWDVDPIAVLDGTDVSSVEGHGLRCLPWIQLRSEEGSDLTIEERLKVLIPAGMTPDMVDQCVRNLSSDQVRLLANSQPTVGQIFPNAAFINSPSADIDGNPLGTLSWRTWIPVAPDKMEVLSWIIVEKGTSEEYKRRLRMFTTQFFTDGGLIDSDDGDVWPSSQRAIKGVMGRRSRANYNALLGINKPDDWPGGGLVYNGISRDDNQWNFWRRWRQFMTKDVW